MKVGAPPGTWDPPTAATTFEQQYTAHPNINAVVTPNDDNANAVISVLLKNKIPANTFPTTGQDASPSGLQNILKGYQCGTVYKPIFAEAQAAAALALFLRADKTPPSSLVNSTTKDTTLNTDIKSVYTKPSGSRRRTWPTRSSRTAGSRRRSLRRQVSRCVQGGRNLVERLSWVGPRVHGGARPIDGSRPVEGTRLTSSRERRRAPPSPQGRLEELRARSGAHRCRSGDPRRAR